MDKPYLTEARVNIAALIKESTDKTYRKASQRIHINSKKRAKRKGIVYELSPTIIEEMLEANAYSCAVTNVNFDFSPTEDRKRRPWFPSLDRIDSDKGYTRDNCRLVCIAANTAMNEWGEEVLFKMAQGIYGK